MPAIETTYVIEKSPKMDEAVRSPAALKRMPNAPSFARVISREAIRGAIRSAADREIARWNSLSKK